MELIITAILVGAKSLFFTVLVRSTTIYNDLSNACLVVLFKEQSIYYFFSLKGSGA